MTPKLVFFLLVGCGDKPPPDPVAPTIGPGNESVVVATPDAAPIEPSRIAARASGKPPVKTTKPLQLTKLGALDVTGLTKTVRKLDDAFLDVEYRLAEPAIVIGVTVQPCLRCLPMQVERWRAESDALRVTIPPDLRDRADTTFEIDAIAIGGAPAIATHQVAFIANDTPIHDHAVAVYFADGVNQIRAIASFAGRAGSRDALVRAVTRRELEDAAVAVLDRYAQSW